MVADAAEAKPVSEGQILIIRDLDVDLRSWKFRNEANAVPMLQPPSRLRDRSARFCLTMAARS